MASIGEVRSLQNFVGKTTCQFDSDPLCSKFFNMFFLRPIFLETINTNNRRKKNIEYIKEVKKIHNDISDISEHVADESADVVVLSLALMGSNSTDYIKESYRVLSKKSCMYVAEPLKKHKNGEDSFIELVENLGFVNISSEKTSNHIYFEFIKK